MPKPIPDGFHAITPHIIVHDSATMIEFYKKAFGATEVMRMLTPDGKKVIHAEVQIGDARLMLCDEFPEWMQKSPFTLGGTCASIHLYVPDADKTYAAAVAAGAMPIMAVTDMFWGDRYGKLSDPSGHVWGIATHKEDLTPAQLKERQAKFFSEMPAAQAQQQPPPFGAPPKP